MENTNNKLEVKTVGDDNYVKNPFRHNEECTIKYLKARCKAYRLTQYSKLNKEELADKVFHHMTFDKYRNYELY
jgi:hypothetical protein